MSEGGKGGSRRTILLWACFLAVLVALGLDDLTSNPVLDEQHLVNDGLATASRGFQRTGFSAGPLYGLVLGFLYSILYLGGLVAGVYSEPVEFMAWRLCHPGTFYLLGRLLTIGLATGGLALLTRALAVRIGAGWATLTCLAFTFTTPSLARIAYATPHGSMVGFSAATAAALLFAAGGRSKWWWTVAGAAVSTAFCAMPIGGGLLFLPLCAATFIPGSLDGLSRAARFGYLALGLGSAFVLFGYPIIFHPVEFWRENIVYQLNRQVLGGGAPEGNLLIDWAFYAPTVWVLGGLGVWVARKDPERAIAFGALGTAAGYMLVLGLLTQSRQSSYSLAALPCLAVSAAHLVPVIRTRRLRVRVALCLALFAWPVIQGSVYVGRRLAASDPKVDAASRMESLVPEGSVVLVDSWWGPRIDHPSLLLAPYPNHRDAWQANPAFMGQVNRCFPPDQLRWKVVAFPDELRTPTAESFRRHGIEYVAVSDAMMGRAAQKRHWDHLVREGMLTPLEEEVARGVRFFRVRR